MSPVPRRCPGSRQLAGSVRIAGLAVSKPRFRLPAVAAASSWFRREGEGASAEVGVSGLGVGEGLGYLDGVVFVQAVLDDEVGEVAGVDAAGQVVAGGDGEEGAGVVHEAR